MFTSFYLIVLTIHGLWRWVALLAALTAASVAVAGLIRRSDFHPVGHRAGIFYMAALDAQLFMGLWLYSISPLVRSAWANLPAAMKTHDLRFFSVEHITTMLLAVVLVHVGAFRGRRAQTDRAKHLNLAGWNVASLAMILVGIPWWRPFLRAAWNG